MNPGGQGGQPRRRDKLIREFEHDVYRARGKPRDPTACPECGVVFRKGRWTWAQAPPGAHAAPCPACQRIRDRYPAGFVTLAGPFLEEHRRELLQLARNVERKERGEHPLHRIMEIEDGGAEVLITTTDPHLARRIGEAVHRSYAGSLRVNYSDEEHSLRVRWER